MIRSWLERLFNFLLRFIKNEPPEIYEPGLPGYLKRINAKPSNKKVGQSFIISTNLPQPHKEKHSFFEEHFGAKKVNDRVGQTFVTSTSKSNPTDQGKLFTTKLLIQKLNNLVKKELDKGIEKGQAIDRALEEIKSELLYAKFIKDESAFQFLVRRTWEAREESSL